MFLFTMNHVNRADFVGSDMERATINMTHDASGIMVSEEVIFEKSKIDL
jgi:hypothetical protein